MGIARWVRGQVELGSEAKALLDAVEGDVRARVDRWWSETPNSWPSVKAVTRASDDVASELLRYVAAELGKRGASSREYLRSAAYEAIFQRCMKRRLDPAELCAIVETALRGRGHPVSRGTVVAALERGLEAQPDNEGLRKVARSWRNRLQSGGLFGPASSENQRFASRLDRALHGSEAILPKTGDPFGDVAAPEVEAMQGDELARWQPLFALAIAASGSKPGKKFAAAAAEAIATIGTDAFAERAFAWFAAVRAPERELRFGESALAVQNADLLKGLVWVCAGIEHPEKLRALADLARRSLSKIPGHGPVCRKLGNACLLVLSLDGSREAVQRLQALLQRTRYAQVRSLIEGFLDDAAERAGMTRHDLDDLSVPDFAELGLDPSGRGSREIGDCRAELEIVSLQEVNLAWRRADGKTVKGVPKALRETHPGEVKALRTRVKELKQALVTQRNRIEGFWLEGREWRCEDFRERFIDHALMGWFGRRLVWAVSRDTGDTWVAVSWADGALRDLEGEAVACEASDRVRLWHPIESDSAGVLAWRRRLAELGVTQPVKQAHREVYLVTDAELATGTYSNRFAAHILKQHQMNALCSERGWSYALQGAFDGYNVPTRRLESHAMTVEFLVEGILDDTAMSDSGIALYVTTDQVRFRPDDGEPMPLRDVPPLLFSEIMREVDLFVAVASVGNDPNWVDGGHPWVDHEYWQSYAFGELSASAHTRREVLAEILPALKIADRCTLTDRFLEVKGHQGDYRIHLGSGNIQMEPGNRYLCIVRAPGSPTATRGSTWLPFEGDGMLSTILSKALLLADDEKIRDPTILSQIRSR